MWLPRIEDTRMHRCHICLSRQRELYHIDEYLVCEACLTQGRLEELPKFAVASDQERTESDDPAATISSWWNREIPTGVAH